MFEDRSKLYRVLDSEVFGEFLNDWSYFEGQVDVLGDTVCHNLEEAIWRNKGNGSVTVEPTQSYALVEFNVINLDTLLCFFTVGSILRLTD